jgi:integrase
VRFASRPISDGTLNAALRRLGYAKDEVTAHGFRTTASSLLNESGRWHPDAIERQLAHVEGNDIRAACARGDYWEQRVSMLQWWADELDRLRGSVLRDFAPHTRSISGGQLLFSRADRHENYQTH